RPAHAQSTVARQQRPRHQGAGIGRGLALGHQHGRRRCREVWMHDTQQLRRKARVLGVELEQHAGRQEGAGLYEPLDIGVVDLRAIQAQAGRYLGIGACKLAAALSEIAQLLLVETKKTWIHGPLPWPQEPPRALSCSSTRPSSRS